MERLLKKSVMTVLGVVVMLGWWTVRGWFEGKASAESLSHIPTKVWDGGGGTVVLEAEASEPARVSASFETDLQVNDPNHKFLESWERIDAGTRTFAIEVPQHVGGTVEVSIENPKVGSKVRVAIRVNGRVVAEDSLTLDEPLKPGYGFFAQLELGDYSTGKLAED
ncbi:MAG TPA: hypothetical protein VGR67_09200 [Candidatus Polarisedimenticolia bacterium]|jgi:hypothetical protein|nr:hypothetical protein [Candidatus Polarisedimenticolia bacterium]